MHIHYYKSSIDRFIVSYNLLSLSSIFSYRYSGHIANHKSSIDRFIVSYNLLFLSSTFSYRYSGHNANHKSSIDRFIVSYNLLFLSSTFSYRYSGHIANHINHKILISVLSSEKYNEYIIICQQIIYSRWSIANKCHLDDHNRIKYQRCSSIHFKKYASRLYKLSIYNHHARHN
jgi:cytochrome c oxidase subunit IV